MPESRFRNRPISRLVALVATLGLALGASCRGSSPHVGVDLAGLNRGRDGIWDRGAYEYRAAE